LPSEVRLAGLGLCSYDLGFEIFREKVVETKLWSDVKIKDLSCRTERGAMLSPLLQTPIRRFQSWQIGARGGERELGSISVTIACVGKVLTTEEFGAAA
jgi:hypothetical protein